LLDLDCDFRGMQQRAVNQAVMYGLFDADLMLVA
jgi:hypothetical protein